jgi:hypothetical protein
MTGTGSPIIEEPGPDQILGISPTRVKLAARINWLDAILLAFGFGPVFENQAVVILAPPTAANLLVKHVNPGEARELLPGEDLNSLIETARGFWAPESETALGEFAAAIDAARICLRRYDATTTQ